MELRFLSLDPAILVSSCLLCLSVCALLVLVAGPRSGDGGARISKPPPGPRALPLIGTMHHVALAARRAPGGGTHRALRELARAHGPLMSLRMGQVRLAVASSREAAEAILRTHDRNFAFRPPLLVGQIVGYGCSDMVFAPYGPYYKQPRRICLTELLGPARVRAFASIRKDEVAKLVEDIAAAAAAARGPEGSAVNLSRRLTTMTNAVISRAAFGRQNAQHHRFLDVAKAALETAAGFSIPDAFPSFKFLDVIFGLRARLLKARKELDEVLDEIIEQHQQKKSNADRDGGEEEDLIDLLLRLKDQGELEIPISNDNIKAVILNLFLAGTDTSSSLLQWAMSELMRNPDAMAKAQKEVREAVKGKDGSVEEAQVNELSYLRMVVKETLRLHPAVPLLLPRVCQSTCEVAGYEIAPGTRAVVNAWAIARDPAYWAEPERFMPERFAEPGAADLKGTSFELLPFGAGRRMCPGMAFALAGVFLALAELLRRFDWRMPDGTTPEELSMEETNLTPAERKVDLVLVPTPCRDPQETA